MQKYNAVIGVDASLSGSGVCIMGFDEKTTSILTLQTVKSKPTQHNYLRIERFRKIVEDIFAIVGKNVRQPTAFLCIEAYAMMVRGSAVTALPELGSLIRNRCYNDALPWVEYAPSSVKKFGTGKGNAKKNMMLMHVQQKHGHMLVGTGLEFQDDNQGDAFVITLMGVAYARWKQFGILPTKDELAVLKAMDTERFYQLGYDSMV